MPTLAERRKQAAANGGSSASGEFIKFKADGETRYLRFLFDDANTIESHQKFWDEEQKKWLIDEGKGAFRITFNCVEYDKGGANARKVRWELSEYLYNEYLAPYVEKDTPASKNVWEIKARRPGTMDVSYVAFKVEGATYETYPIPKGDESASASAQPAAPTYAAPAQPAAASAPASAPTAPAAPTTEQANNAATAPRKSKYF